MAPLQSYSPAFQVAFDMALEGLQREPSNRGYWWVKCALGENGVIPKVEEFYPGIGEKLVKVGGDMTLAVGSRFDPNVKYIPPGRFLMGSPEDEPGRNYDETQHKVTLTKGFWMMEHPVTQAQWELVMGNNPSYFKDGGPSCPIENVSWDDVQTFIQKVSARDGVSYRLPTEAEWEYAARGGQSYIYAGSDDPCKVGWSGANSGVITHPVCQKQKNGYGLYDMSGNVWEWVQDRYDVYPGNAVDNKHLALCRVARGGSHASYTRFTRVASREFYTPSGRYYSLGFRLVMEMPKEMPKETL